jgi:hypothetical protein
MPDPIQQIPNVDPSSLARIAQMFGAGGGGGLGTSGGQAFPSPAQPTSPAQGVLPMDLETAIAKQLQMGTEQAPVELQRFRERQDTIEGLGKKEASLPVPKMGWAEGVHNPILRALVSIAGATTPGQRIQEAQYGPGIARYGAEKGAIAKQIAELQGEQAQEPGVMQGLTAGPGRTLTGAGMYGRGVGAVESGQAALQRAAAFQTDVQSRVLSREFENELRAANVDVAKAKAALDRAMPSILQGRIDVEARGQDVNAYTRQSVANALIEAGVQKETPILDRVTNFLTTGSFTPTKAEAPGGGQPVTGPTPAAKRPPKRPAGVPAGAQWNEGAQQWQLPARNQ